MRSARFLLALVPLVPGSLVIACSSGTSSHGQPDRSTDSGVASDGTSPVDSSLDANAANDAKETNDTATPVIDSGAAVDSGAIVDSGSAADGATPDDSAAPPSGDAAAPPVDGSSTTGATGCMPLSVDSTTMVNKSNADTYGWYDGACNPRTAAMIRNDAVDGYGEAGGYLNTLTYVSGGQTRTCAGTGANGWWGFGYIVNHYASTDFNTQNTQGQYSIVLSGRHHAIHQYTWTISPGGTVNATVQWFFATGRDHPLYIITYDATPAGPNVVNADTRAPYGDMAFDDNANGPVNGDGWGDKYQFKTTGPGPVTPDSAWDYTQPNVVPYAYEWITAADAEMGLVATQPFATRVQGGDYGGGLLESKWGTTGTALFPADASSTQDMPDWLWPFQLNNYDIQYVNNSHRLAWGATYGAVGQTSYVALGQTFSGYPYQSYSVFVVLGTHSTSAVGGETAEVASVAGSTLVAARGTVNKTGPAGIARADTITYVPAGFDPVYAVWDAEAAQNAATLTLAVPAGSSLTNPVFRLHGYTANMPPSAVTFGGAVLTADVDYFATVDATTGSLWLTLNRTVQGGGTLTVDP